MPSQAYSLPCQDRVTGAFVFSLRRNPSLLNLSSGAVLAIVQERGLATEVLYFMKEIPLTKGKVAIVDDEDFDRVSAFKWQACESEKGGWYACRTAYNTITNRPMVYLHRFILGSPKSHVDHRNRNGLDNRRKNLRIASRSQNQANVTLRRDNTLGYKGVVLRRGGWGAQIRHQGSRQWLGVHPTKETAARAYDTKALELFGEFACLNFPVKETTNE